MLPIMKLNLLLRMVNMKQKIIVIFLLLATLIAVGTVSAQVCLGKTAARVNVSGSDVTVRNSMQDQPISVEVYYYNTKRSNGQWVNDGSKQTLYFDNIPAMGSKSLSLPANAKYDDYEVFSCK